MHVVMTLAGHHPPGQDTVTDAVFWRRSQSGQFTVKSADEAQEQLSIQQGVRILYGNLYGNGRVLRGSKVSYGLWHMLNY